MRVSLTSRNAWIACLLVCACRQAWALEPSRTISQYVRDHWGMEQGFPRGPVYALAQTPDGYLWIGTESGLIRFDGIKFVPLKAASGDFGPITHVLGLSASRDGVLWARLRRPTLLRYGNGSFEDALKLVNQPTTTLAALSLSYDGNPLLWLLQGEPSAAVIRDGKLETLATPAHFSRSPVLALTQTKDQDVWVGTRDAGLFRLRGNQTTSIRQGLPDLKVNAIAHGANGELWVGTDNGVVRWNGTALTSEGVPKELQGVQALTVHVDRDGNLWTGTNADGLIRVNRHGVATMGKTGPDGSSQAITAIFEDQEGDLWIGSSSGLDRLRDSSFISYSTPEGFPPDAGGPIYVDASGRLWFGPSSGGVAWMRGGKSGRISTAGLDGDLVYSIDGGKDAEELWVGRQRGGLTRFRQEGGTWAARTFTRKDGLAQDSVYSVYRARSGDVWAGTLSGGASRFNPATNRFESFTAATGLSSNTINAILQSSAPDDAMWFGTPAGLDRYARGKWQSFGAREGMPQGAVNCLAEDSSGMLWVGTSAGLMYRTPAGFRAAGSTLPSLREAILGVAEDRLGWLWIVTSGHVIRVNRQKLVAGTLGENDWREYGTADGLRGTEGVKRYRSAVSDSEGKIWIALDKGISFVDPARLKRAAAPAVPRIEEMTADGSNVPIRGSIRIPGGIQRIKFSYAGVALTVPLAVAFRYQLESFDKAFSAPTLAREAVYTNLPPGNYRFRLMARNADGIWSTSEASVGFEVEPLVWQTWWFRAGVCSFAIATIVLIYRYRLEQARRRLNLRFEERLAERTRIAQELHDTLLQGVLSASMQVHVAANGLPADSPVKSQLARAGQLMRQVIGEGRNALRGLRPSHSVSFDLEEALALVPEELSAGGESHKDVEFPIIVDGATRSLHPLLRDEVYRITREAITNAFRHAEANKITVHIEYLHSELRMTVRDDGHGIDPAIVSSGRDGHFGLSGMRERAERIGATLDIWSEKEGGTELELTVPGHIAYQDHRRGLRDWLMSRGRKEKELGS